MIKIIFSLMIVFMTVQPKPTRPIHINEPENGHDYWCIIHPEFKDKSYLVNLPWKGKYQDGKMYFPRNNLINVEVSEYNLFSSKEDAENAIIFDWNNPPRLVSNKIIISKELLNRIKKSLNNSKSISDNLTSIDMDEQTKQQFLASLALSMNMQIVPKMSIDEPVRDVR